MDIVTIDQPDHTVLREPAQTMVFPLSKDIKKFALALLAQMRGMGNAVGLAATQVGKPWRIIAFHVDETVKKYRKNVHGTFPPTLLINPSYEALTEEKAIDWEGCFSIPDKMGEVPRYIKIHYSGYTIDGAKVSAIAEGFLARVIQHEIDHLNGKLYKDHLSVECRYGDSEEMWKIRQEELKK